MVARVGLELETLRPEVTKPYRRAIAPHICLISDHNDTFRKIMPKYITKNYLYQQTQSTQVTQRHKCLPSERVGITKTETTDLQSDTINTSSTDTHTHTHTHTHTCLQSERVGITDTETTDLHTVRHNQH